VSDPVFYDEAAFDDMRSPGGWYFWDETWSHAYGPFATEREARRALDYYINMELG